MVALAELVDSTLAVAAAVVAVAAVAAGPKPAAVVAEPKPAAVLAVGLAAEPAEASEC